MNCPREPRPIRSPRRAFTLTELLVAITIVVILAATILFGMAGVQNTAKIQRTRSQIARIHEMIAEKWESYETRRVNPDTTTLMGIASDRRVRRLLALRELIRLELPDRQSDVLPPSDETTEYGNPIPSLARFYRDYAHRPSVSNSWGDLHEGAECLYMILSRIQVGEGNGLEFFPERDIGDKDSDGMPELWDGWGNPISFLRWPAGFDSLLYQLPIDTNTSQPGIQPPPDAERDPFDLARVDDKSYYIFPLILSAGPDLDGKFGIFPLDLDPPNKPQVFFGGAVLNNPYQPFTDSNSLLGQMTDVGQARDNIHNHLIGTATK